MAQVTCSFCGRNKKDVDLMISGIHAHICDKCIAQAQQILDEELKTKEETDSPNLKLIKPTDMKRHLDQFVIGQDEAKRYISVAVYNHYKRLLQEKSTDDIQIENEEQLLDIILNWINYDSKQRTGCIDELLEPLRLPFIHQSHIQGKLDQLSDLHRRDAKKIRSWNKNTRKIDARKSYRRVEAIVVTGGCDKGLILDSGFCFIPAVQKWTQIPNMQVPRWR